MLAPREFTRLLEGNNIVDLQNYFRDERGGFLWRNSDGSLNKAGGRLLRRHLESKCLPRWIHDPGKNAFRIAMSMIFLDGRILHPSIREGLGLDPTPPAREDYDFPHCYPNRIDPFIKGYIPQSCSNSERYMENVVLHTEIAESPKDPPSNISYHPWVLYDAVVGKSLGYTLGLCTKTVEFPNGTILIPDVWYDFSPEDRVRISDTLRLASIPEGYDAIINARNDEYFFDPTSIETGYPVLMLNPKSIGIWPVRGIHGNRCIDTQPHSYPQTYPIEIG